MSWFVLALLCAASLAAADALTQKWLARHTAAELVLVRFTLAAVWLVPWLLLHPPHRPAPTFWLWVGTALPLEILAMVLYVRAIRNTPLALTLPYMAFTPVFASAVGWLLLGEKLSTQGLVGVLLVTGGAYVLNLDHARLAEPRSWLAPFAAMLRERGSRLMLAVALIYSVTSVQGKAAMQYMSAMEFGALYFVLLGTLTLLLFGVREPASLRVLMRPGPGALIVAALMGLMVVTHFLALERIQTAYMIAVKRVSILFGILFGALLFGDRRLPRHLFAGGVMVAGVALIVLQKGARP
ncbi:DMT family transporter [Thiobacter aerophilum]|uniref:DMT family transporter n=1 Tax=Thiobacter aerophilum TaxID=3121275 RepID=A0ABV0EDQ8_9BURK